MFRFQSIHMYGILGIAVGIGVLSVFLIKKLNLKSVHQEQINLSGKPFSKGHILGGILFGFGWAMTGACPGPLYALIGSGYWIILPILLSAIFGAYAYGRVKSALPH